MPVRANSTIRITAKRQQTCSGNSPGLKRTFGVKKESSSREVMAVHLNEAPLYAVRDDGGVHQERREIAEEVVEGAIMKEGKNAPRYLEQ